MPRFLLAPLAPALLLLAALPAQAQTPDPSDVSSPEAIVAAAYGALERQPGAPFDWDRFRSLFLPQATLLPNTEQTGGSPRVFSPEEFVAWVEASYAEHAPIGSPKDQGFAEEEVRSEVRRYGDVAQVFSTYQKRYWGAAEILGRGINSYQLVHRDGRWWIVSVVWDEESGAGPIPAEYLE